jgi:cell division septation protein DedD
MTTAAKAAAFDDEIDELEDFDDEEGEDERGLSGLVVLLMGIVMLGALASVVWIAYQYGVRTGEERGGAPYVTAEPEPLKIENQIAEAAGAADREVYDAVAGAENEPVEVIASGPEEPVARTTVDPIGAIAAGETAGLADDAVADRIAELARADEAARQPEPVAEAPKTEPRTEPKPATPATPVNVAKPAPAPASAAGGDALSGSHLVQVGAFRSQAEADGQWAKMQGKLGAFLDGKGKDVEVADLGAKGTYYRLRVGPFASADEAKTYCAGLKERGTDCLIKAK